MKGQWTNVYSGDLSLRSWWVDSDSECTYIYSFTKGVWDKSLDKEFF